MINKTQRYITQWHDG